MSIALNSVGADEFESLLASFNLNASPTQLPIAVAVSGGPDSMALAFCLHRWAKARNKNCVALIVDHMLRTESTQEAAQVKINLERLGIAAEILRWDHPPITNRLHEQARAARYALLTRACHRLGAKDLMIAHHRDDQAETILMRLTKGSGVEGMAGMQDHILRDNIRILRPFLTLPKARLTATCRAAGIPYVTDPGNQSDQYARGRLRTLRPLLEQEGFTIEALLDLGARAREAHQALDHYARIFLHDRVTCEIGGSIRIQSSDLKQIPQAIALRVLSEAMHYIVKSEHAPERSSLLSLLQTILNHGPGRTLNGCLITPTEGGILILREPSAATEIIPFRPHEALVWDNRWIISGSTDAAENALNIGALGNPAHDILDRLAPRLRHIIAQGRVRATLPALWKDNVLWAIPSFEPTAPLRMSYKKPDFARPHLLNVV